MLTSILKTKLHIPKPQANVVTRPRLMQQLSDGLNRKLTLISAPAGFGKTTLTSQWLADVDCPTAWLSLDQGDNDLMRFLTYLIVSLQTIDAQIGEELLRSLQSPQPPTVETILTTLINDLIRIEEDFVFVLDDYHLIDTQSIDDALQFLLEHLPSHAHLVMTTREDPQLPLARLRVRNQLIEVRASDLRFVSDEITLFLNQTMNLSVSADDVVALEARTEGWVASLQLAAISIQGNKDTSEFIQSFTGTHRFMLDYLIEEILRHQPESVQKFLLETSILTRMCGSLCDAVIADTSQSGQELLEYLERANLLLIPLDNHREWYRYHHLFTDVLQAHMLKEEPEKVSTLHLRACEWYEANGFRADAIHHALTARDYDKSADLIELIWSEAQRDFQSDRFLEWLKQLPEEMIKKRPILCVAYSWILIIQGNLATSLDWLEIAESWLPQYNDEIPLDAVVVNHEQWQLFEGSIAIIRTLQAQTSRHTKDVIKYAQQALDLLPEDDHFLLAFPTGILAFALWGTGELEKAYHYLFESRVAMQKSGQIISALTGSNMLAHLQWTLGNLYDAISLYENSLQIMQKQNTPISIGRADLLLGLSEIYLEQSKLDMAIDYLERSTLLEESAHDAYQYRSRIVKARLKEVQGDLQGAVTILEDAERVYTSGIVPNVRPVAALKARIWIKQEKLHDAWRWAHERELAVDSTLSYLSELEHITFVRLLMAEYQLNQTSEHLQHAEQLLERLLQSAETGQRIASVIEILILQALSDRLAGKTDDALAHLNYALSLAEPESFAQIFLDEGLPLAQLLGEALKRDTNQSFIRHLLAKFDTQPNNTVTDSKHDPSQPLLEPLSERELDVLRLFKTDLSGPEIADELVVALSTVRTHTKGIYRKLDVNNRRSAVRRAESLGII